MDSIEKVCMYVYKHIPRWFINFYSSSGTILLPCLFGVLLSYFFSVFFFFFVIGQKSKFFILT